MPNKDMWVKLAPKAPPLPSGKRWHVFISYRSVNRPWVINLYDVLHEHGYEVFLDQCVLKAGDRLIKSLGETLSKSASGILVWSESTRDSEFCDREHESMEALTIKGGFHYVPIVLDGSEVPGLPGNRLSLNFRDYPDGPNGGELLRLLFALTNQPLTPEAARFATAQDEEARSEGAAVGAAIKNGDFQRLLDMARADKISWNTSSSLGCKATEGLTKLARYDDAIALARALHEKFPRAIRPRQLEALALARRAQGNDLMDAQHILGTLYERGERDPETVGIYARTWMDRYQVTGDRNFLRTSRDYYLAAFEAAPDDYYCGINAAAKSVLLGDEENLAMAKDIAAQVQKLVGETAVAKDYWKSATVAEVRLIQRDFKGAGRLYESAVAMAPSEVGSHGTTWKQAERLMEQLKPTVEERAWVAKPFDHVAKKP